MFTNLSFFRFLDVICLTIFVLVPWNMLKLFEIIILPPCNHEKRTKSNQFNYLQYFCLNLYLPQPFNGQCSHHMGTSQLICSANQLTSFYMMGTLAVKRLRKYEIGLKETCKH